MFPFFHFYRFFACKVGQSFFLCSLFWNMWNKVELTYTTEDKLKCENEKNDPKEWEGVLFNTLSI